MELREYIRIITKSWWIIIPLTFIALTVSLIFSYSRTPIFEASATYITRLQSGGSQDTDTLIFGLDTLTGRQRIFVTYCEIMTSLNVREEAFRLVGLELTEELIEKYEVACTNLPETNVLLLRVQGPSPTLVIRLSEAIGIVGTAQANDLYEFFPLDKLDPVKLAENQVSPKYTQNAVLGGALGLIVGVALSFLLEYLRSPLERLEGQSIRNLQLGTYNERYFRERFEQEIDRAHARNRPITMAITRLDPREDFEIYPEVVQFKLLRAAAMMMQDAVHQRNLVASLQPRTFGVLLAETSGDEALEVFKHLHDDLRAHSFEADGYITNFEATTGLVTSSGGEFGYKSMLDKTFVALDVAEEKDNRIYLVRATPRPFGDTAISADSLPFGNIDIPDSEGGSDSSIWSLSDRRARSLAAPSSQSIIDVDAPADDLDMAELAEWLGTATQTPPSKSSKPVGADDVKRDEFVPRRESERQNNPSPRQTNFETKAGTQDSEDQNFILGKVFNNITENLIPKSPPGRDPEDRKE